MELKVWVEGIQRIVCGVTVNTTCQDVVFALAHATGKVGRFTLIERWRNNERLLAPNENPLKLLIKWGEYANDVQFILQRSEQNTQKQLQQQVHNQEQQQQQHQKTEGAQDRTSQMNAALVKKPLGLSNTNTIHSMNSNNSNSSIEEATQHKRQPQQQQPQQLKNMELNITSVKELRKSFGNNDSKTIENVGIVKGIPQRQGTKPSSEITGTTTKHFTSPSTQQQQHSHSPQITNDIQIYTNNNNNDNNENININNINNNNIYAQIGPKSKPNTHEINLNEVRNNSQDRRSRPESPEIMFTTPSANNSNENLLDIFSGSYNNQHNAIEQQQVLYNNNVAPTISANGALVPPPYRDPPPPRNSPLQQYSKSSPNADTHRAPADSQSSPVCQNCNGSMMHDVAAHGAGVCSNPFLNDYNDFDLDMQNGSAGIAMSEEGSESIFQATQYNDLLALIKFQREKISLQQTELSKYDAEIVYLESKERDQAQELESISREITKTDQIFRQGSEQLQTLQYVEEENELVKQQEKTLKSEIALLRSKLANCETELLQCKNKIRILMDDIEVEQRAVSSKQKSNRQSVERDFLIEMERIQSEIDQAMHNTDTSNKTTESLKKEILLIENAIAEKKRQVEQLVNEMKEVNLQSLTVTTSEEIKHLLEGSNKPGSSRRIIGSPRQLENAVPTSKNPHGVWV